MLADSPAGQCAWIVEKFAAWSDGDGDPERVFSRDALLEERHEIDRGPPRLLRDVARLEAARLRLVADRVEELVAVAVLVLARVPVDDHPVDELL